MIRAEKEMRDRKEMEQLLREANIGRLGMSIGDSPYIIPINFVYIDGKIFFHCGKRGKKIDIITRNPQVCFEVDEGEIVPKEKPCDYTVKYRSVIATGRARIHTKPGDMLEPLKLIVDKYAKGYGAELTKETVSSYSNLVVVEITINEVTGKRSPS